MVSSTSPADAATAVARNSPITATFSEDIFAVTVNATSFTLTSPTTGNVAGSVTFDGASNVATFAPGNVLAMLAPYTATLSTAITDLSGNALSTAFSWSFTTEDGSWGSAELIESDNAGHTFDPQIAFDNNGNALAVWEQYDGTRNSIWANRFDGTNWGSAVLIETDNTGSALVPQIAMDSNGNALAVWSQFYGTRDSIWANRFDGTNWGSAELIESDNAGHARDPQIAMDSNGNALAVWEQFDGIWANRFDGTNWGSAALIDSDNAGDASDPQIAMDSNGNALAVWQQYDGIRNNIWANHFDGTSWGSAALIETGAGSARDPQIAFDNNGNALAVWRQNDGTRNSIWANRFGGTSWGSAALIDSDNARNALDPQIAFDNNGNALAVWQQYDGIRNNIWANRFGGTSWGSAELIESDNAGHAFYPQIAMDSNGNALAVWQQFDGTRNNIWANRFDGTNWGNAALIESDNAGGARDPQIAFDNNGNALAVWRQNDGIRHNIRANRFE